MSLVVEVLDESGEIDEVLLSQVLANAYERIEHAPPGEWACSARVAGSDEIAALHDRFFGDPTDTDVMSFPSGESLDSDGGYLGDIAISVSMAATQAEEAGHSLQREVVYLALHGLLHLVGFDDEHDDDRRAMLELQDSLLSSIEQSIGRRM